MLSCSPHFIGSSTQGKLSGTVFALTNNCCLPCVACLLACLIQDQNLKFTCGSQVERIVSAMKVEISCCTVLKTLLKTITLINSCLCESEKHVIHGALSALFTSINEFISRLILLSLKILFVLLDFLQQHVVCYPLPIK